jgi:hypothetical protein
MRVRREYLEKAFRVLAPVDIKLGRLDPFPDTILHVTATFETFIGSLTSTFTPTPFQV